MVFVNVLEDKCNILGACCDTFVLVSVVQKRENQEITLL